QGDLHIVHAVSDDASDGDAKYEITHDALAQPIRDWRERYRQEQDRAAQKARQEQLVQQVETERTQREEAEREALEAARRAARERKLRNFALGALAVAVI